MSADSVMGIAQMGVAAQATKIQTDLSVAVARKSMDVQQTEGALALKLIESAQQVAPEPQGLIDVVA